LFIWVAPGEEFSSDRGWSVSLFLFQSYLHHNLLCLS
jgi:hypothetical protein